MPVSFKSSQRTRECVEALCAGGCDAPGLTQSQLLEAPVGTSPVEIGGRQWWQVLQLQAGAFQGQAEQLAGGYRVAERFAESCVELLLNPRSVEVGVHGRVRVGEPWLIRQCRYSVLPS